VKVKKANVWDFAFMTFANDADRDAAVKGLSGHAARSAKINATTFN
jgi:hypothetical protein